MDKLSADIILDDWDRMIPVLVIFFSIRKKVLKLILKISYKN